MKSLQLTALIAGLCIPLISCKKPSTPIVVKGLYINMPVASLNTVVKDKLGGDWTIKEYPENKTCFINKEGLKSPFPYKLKWESDYDPRLDPTLTYDDYRIGIQYNEAGLVELIRIGSQVSDCIFQTSSLDQAAFGQMFVNAYDIPHMEGKSGYSEYIKDDLSVKLYIDKTIVLEKIVPLKDTQKNFN